MGFLRLLGLSLRSLLRGRRSLFETSVLGLRVWPPDLDLNLHMNNARYLSIMDLGRVDVLLAGGLGLWGRRGRQPLVAASFCRYFKPLRPFQAYELHTRLAGFDEKWFYFEQRFIAKGRLYTLGAVKGLMVGSDGAPIPTRELFAGIAAELPASPPLPGWMLDWLRCERSALDHLKSEARPGSGPLP